MNRIIKDTIKLLIITAVAGLLLGGTYVVTKEPIARAKAAALQESYKKVFKDAEKFVDAEIDLDKANELLVKNGYETETIDNIVLAVDSSNNTLGYVFTLTTSEGFGGNITLSVGIKNDGTVNGYSALTITETAGLGMKAKEEPFMSQFKDKIVEKFVVTKNGSTSDDEINALSGATITTNAITKSVNACIFYMNNELAGTEVE